MPLLVLAVLAVMAFARSAHADDAPLFEHEPFDTIRLDDDNKGVVLKVQPLDLPNRHLPGSRNPTDEIEIHLLDHPKKAYKVAWGHIVEVKLFEQMVLDEAEQLTNIGKLDEAYPYYEFLERRYPKMTGLPEAYEKYLLAGAGTAYKQARFEESLGLLWALYDRNPQHKGITTAIQHVVEKLFDRWLAEENYVAARGILREAAARLKDQAQPWVGERNAQLENLAVDRLRKAKEDFRAGRFVEARHACRQALAAWPEVTGGVAVAAAMQAKYPMVEVGVRGLSPFAESAEQKGTVPLGGTIEAGASAADAWASDRTTRLLTRRIAEPARLEGDAVVYDTPLVERIAAADRRLSLTVKPGIHWPGGAPITAADLAQSLLAAADAHSPAYRPEWVKLVAGVTLPAVDRVELELHEPIQHAERWLTVPLWHGDRSGLGPYRIAGSTPQEVRYLAVDDYFAATKSEPREIIERVYPNTAAALDALRRGDVQVVDRVEPFAAHSLKDSANIVVEPYAAPTLHLLVFNRRGPMAASAIFRRAVAHAIDRQSILNDTLAHGESAAGARIADAVGTQPSGDTATPAEFRYDPSAAMVLLQVARSEAQSPAASSPASAVRFPFFSRLAPARSSAASGATLTLEYPPDEVARIACAAIQRQFTAVGLTLKLRERSSTATPPVDTKDAADLVYVELRPGESASRSARLPGGSGDGPGIAELLSQAQTAPNSDGRSTKLADAEQTLLGETLVIPLWRLTDSIAYRRELQGVGSRPMTLYQNVENWRLAGEGE